MNKTHGDKNEYFKTVMWTIFVAIIVVVFSLIDLGTNIQTKKEKSLEKLQLINIRPDLEKLYYLEKKDPGNYMINLKIAVLHEVLKEYNQAEVNYEKALAKSNNNPLALYKTAMFFATQKRYKSAIDLMDLLPNIQNKKLFEMRAKFYSKLGHIFLEDKDYANSIKAYKLAYKYARNTNPQLKINTAKAYSNAYNEYADKFINDNDAALGVQMLKNAIEIYPDPYAKYKLGLIYINLDDEKAQKYIEETYASNPDIVNLELYNNLLNKLIKTSGENQDFSKVRFYTLKLDHLKRKIKNYNIFSGDLGVIDLRIQVAKRFFFSKKRATVVFNLKNNTKYGVENLFIKTVISTDINDNFESEEKIITGNNPLPAEEMRSDIKIPIDLNIAESDAKYFQIQIYARKNIRAPWTLISYSTVTFIK